MLKGTAQCPCSEKKWVASFLCTGTPIAANAFIFCLITPSYGTAVTSSQHVMIIRSDQWESGLKMELVASDFLASQLNG
jgi:hypothetical protein